MNTNPTIVVVGEFLSETSYYKVDGKNINGLNGVSTRLTNSKGEQLQITDGLLGTTTYSASQYTIHEEVSATQLAQLVTEVGDTVFTASFQKLPTAKDIEETIKGLNRGSIVSTKETFKRVKDVFNGEERVIVARLLSIEALMGRAKVIDLEVDFELKKTGNAGSSIRLIDLRNLNWIVFKGTKFIKKK